MFSTVLDMLAPLRMDWILISPAQISAVMLYIQLLCDTNGNTKTNEVNSAMAVIFQSFVLPLHY